MSTEDFWGDIPEIGMAKTPVEILKEQATILTAKTKGVVVADVQPVQTGNPNHLFGFVLAVRAPALNNYVATVVRITYPIEMYPLVFKGYNSPQEPCPTEADFVEHLKAALGSDGVRKLISALLIQSNATQQPQTVLTTNP
jgi:hypothetical protein